jgi:PAS domain S-box-containing protein
MESNKSLNKKNAALTLENSNLKAHDSQERFRTVFEYSRLANKIISPELKIIRVNMALIGLFGCTAKEEITGTHILDYSPPEDHRHWKLLQEQLSQKETPFFNLEPRML